MAEDRVVLVEKLDIPEGVNRKEYFYSINKDLQVVATKKTKDMWKKAGETRKRKAQAKKKKEEISRAKRLEIEKRKQERVLAKKAKLEMKLKEIEANEEKRKKVVLAKMKKL